MFRIQPGVEISDPDAIWTTFENVKLHVNAALLTMVVDIPVASAIALNELVVSRKIPYMIDQNSAETIPLWKKGALSVEISTFAQGVTFDMHIALCKLDAAPAEISSLTCVVPAGAKMYRRFTAFAKDVDFTPYYGILLTPEVSGASAAADRFSITVQLTFHPFAPFGVA